MGFFRRKSYGPTEEDRKSKKQQKKEIESVAQSQEQQLRNRLSKPPTNKSYTNLQVQPEIDAATSKKNLIPLEIERTTSPLEHAESRELLRSRIFGPDADTAPTASTPIMPQDQCASAASMVNDIENSSQVASKSQVSPTASNKSPRPFSGLFGSRRSSGAQKRPGLITRGSEGEVLSASSSRDQIAEDFAPRPRRHTTYAPGSATRTPSGNDKSIDEESQEVPIKTTEEEMPAVKKEKELFDEPDDWMPPAPIFRAGTPADLDYTHLGGLRLGSLQIMNGRASPAASDLNKHLRDRLIRSTRNVSSVYGDSEDGTAADEQWEDMEVPDEDKELRRTLSRPKQPAVDRQFSFARGEDPTLGTMQELASSLGPTTISPPHTPKTRDCTSALADSYIAELALSPYAASPPSSIAGSVRRHRGKGGDRSFENEISERSPERAAESVASWHSLSGPESQPDEVFLSAVELQPTISNDLLNPDMLVRSSNKSDSGYSSNISLGTMDRKQEQTVTLHHSTIVSPQVVVRKEIFIPPRKKMHQSLDDATPTQTTTTTPARTTVNTPEPLRTPEAIPRRKLLSVGPPVEAAQPQTFDSNFIQTQKPFEVSPTKPTDSTLSLTKTNESASKPAKARKKLQKVRRQSTADVAREIVVQGASSHDCHLIPTVTNDAHSHLAMRSEAVPELERTFQTHDSAHNQANQSVLSFHVQDIRFPSPAPESEQDSGRSGSWFRPKKRERSLSRPRTWFSSLSRRNSTTDRKISGAGDEDIKATIGDFGDVVGSLGTNPYDIAQAGPPPQTSQTKYPPNSFRSSPHQISVQNQRPKSMMDDRIAAQFSKMRTRSSQEKEKAGSRRSSFNDRGGIPGKNLRPESITAETPPLPPMPARESLERRYSNRISSYEPHLGSNRSSSRNWAEQFSSANFSSELESSPPPPPPHIHSPVPMYHDQDEEQEQYEYEAAPPPPSHSPRPRDITPEPHLIQEDAWAAPASAWRAHRESVSNALRSSWDKQDNVQGEYYAHDGEYFPPEQQYQYEEPLYPEIPQRNEGKWEHSEHLQSNHAAQIWADEEYQDALRDYYSHQESTPLRPLPNPHQQQPSYLNQSYNSHHEDSRSRSRFRSRSRSPYESPSRPRPHSQHSFASSLAEELHPAEYKRVSPAPDFGRYSGGLQYGYEGRENGFGGSAGTRSVSGKADGKRRSVAHMNTYGLDFSDIPPMGVPMGAVGSRFKYEYHD